MSAQMRPKSQIAPHDTRPVSNDDEAAGEPENTPEVPRR
jgi:hypothetical protein